MSRARDGESRSRWGGTAEPRQVTSSAATAMKREARGTFRVKDRARGTESITSSRSVQQVFGTTGNTTEDSYSRSYSHHNTYNNDDSDSSGGWERNSLDGSTRRKHRLSKSSTTANISGRKESRSSRSGLETSRSSTSINEVGTDVKKGRMKSTDIDRMVDRLSNSKRTSRDVRTHANDNKSTRKSTGNTARADMKRPSPPTDYKRSNTFDMDKEDNEEPASTKGTKVGAHKGRGRGSTPPQELRRSNTFEKDDDEAPVSRQKLSASRESPAVAWPSNANEEDGSNFQVVMRKRTDDRSSFEGGTFVRRKKTERTSVSNRWSFHSEEDSYSAIGAGSGNGSSARLTSDDMPSLFSKTRQTSRDKSLSDIMSSSPDLSSYTSSRDYSPFPSGKLQKDRPQDRSNASICSVRSRNARDSPAKDTSSDRNLIVKPGRVAFSDILERASKRRSGKPVSVESSPAAQREIGKPYRSIFSDNTKNKSEPQAGGLEAGSEDLREPVPIRDTNHTPDSAAKGDGFGRRFRNIFKKRRDSEESDNSGKDTGFSSGRSNSPSRDSFTAERDGESRRDARLDGVHSSSRVPTHHRSTSPEPDQTQSPRRSSSPSKSGSSTPKRPPSPDKEVSPPPRYGGGRAAALSPAGSDVTRSPAQAAGSHDADASSPLVPAPFSRTHSPRARIKVESATDDHASVACDVIDDAPAEGDTSSIRNTRPLRTNIFSKSPDKKSRTPPAENLQDRRRPTGSLLERTPVSTPVRAQERESAPAAGASGGRRWHRTEEPEAAVSADILPDQEWMRQDCGEENEATDENRDQYSDSVGENETEKTNAANPWPTSTHAPSERPRGGQGHERRRKISPQTSSGAEHETESMFEELRPEDGPGSLIPVEQYASESDAASDHSLDIEFDRMRLNSAQQEDTVTMGEKQRSVTKDDIITFSAGTVDNSLKRDAAPVGADDTLKRPRQPADAPPDVAQTPAATLAPTTSSTATASSRAASSSQASSRSSTMSRAETAAGDQKVDLSHQEQLLKRDRDIQVLQDTVSKLKNQLAASQSAQQRMSKVVEMHTSALARLAASRWKMESQLSQQTQRLTAERDEAREEVANIEAMFADLHRKYEKSKSLLLENKQTSGLVAVELDQVVAQVSREQQRYDMLQQYAEDTMQRLQADMMMEQKSQETETLRMSARLQLAENRATKLERENKEVTAICDELIQKMGGAR